MGKEADTGRRDLLKLTALTGATALVTGIPLATYVVTPARQKGTSRWIELGGTDELAPGQVHMLTYEFMVKDGWLVLPQKGFVWVKAAAPDNLTVFSSTCTHLACNVIWREEAQVFECPCHSGRFNADGAPVAGPPRRSLAVIEHKIEDGKLRVYLTA
jgi:Rieske Fe-S protein